MTRALCALGCLALFACSQREARTQIMLEVAVESSVLDDVRVLEIAVHVSGDRGEHWQKRVDQRFDVGDVGGAWSDFDWPARLGLVPADDGVASIVYARAAALGADDSVLVAQSVAAAFVRGRTKLVRIELLAPCRRGAGTCDDPRCVGFSCFTCRKGDCVKVRLADELPDYEPNGTGIIVSNEDLSDAGDAASPEDGGHFPTEDSGGFPTEDSGGFPTEDSGGSAAKDSPAAPVCGDGVQEDDELCDDGAGNSDIVPDACRSDCVPARCGDGVRDATEECDDGASNTADQSGTGPARCAADCSAIPRCGDGVAQGTEVCDDGPNNGQREHCDRTCAFECVGNCPLRVDLDAAPGGDGLSWQTAMSDPQAAVTQAGAQGGGQVWLKRGTYQPTGSFDGTALLTIPTPQEGRLEIYGGFVGDETSLAQRDPAIYDTVLSGAQITLHVVWGSGDYLLDGVTIIDGRAAPSPDATSYRGAGIYNTAGSPTIRNCAFHDNQSWGAGGAIYNEAAYPLIEHCHFENNEAVDNAGGAIYVEGMNGTVRIRDSVFIHNDADSYSASIIDLWATCAEPACGLRLELESVRFAMNRTRAIGLHNASLHATGVEFTGNYTAGEGGSALMVDASSSAELRRCAILASDDTDGWTAAALANAGQLRISDCRIEGNLSRGGFLSNGQGATAHIVNTRVLADILPADPGGLDPSPGIGNGGTLEIVNCSFGGTLVDLIGTSGPTLIVNSALWRGRISGAGPVTITHSCLDSASAYPSATNVELDASPFDQNGFLQPGAGDPCLDAGDAQVAEEWQIPWQQLTTQASGCLDSGAIDLGVHLPAPDGAVPCL